MNPFHGYYKPINESDGNYWGLRNPLPPEVGNCGYISECSGTSENQNKVKSIIHSTIFHFHDCLSHYCGLTGESVFCIVYDQKDINVDKMLSTLSITTIKNIPDVKISCDMEMTGEKMEGIMNFTCTWEPKYYGIVATITLSDADSTMNHTCSDLPQDGFHIMKISALGSVWKEGRSKLFTQ